jgi:hypothetical protein
MSGIDICGSGHGEITGCCKHSNEPPVSIKHGKFLDYLRNCLLLERAFLALISQLVTYSVSWQPITWMSELTGSKNIIINSDSFSDDDRNLHDLESLWAVANVYHLKIHWGESKAVICTCVIRCVCPQLSSRVLRYCTHFFGGGQMHSLQSETLVELKYSLCYRKC